MGSLLLPAHSELLREHDVISDFLADRLLNLVTLKFDEVVLDYVILLELVPVFLSLVEDDCVSEVQDRSIIGPEVLVHHTFIHNELLLQLTICSVVIELEGLHELSLVVGVPLEGLNDWHATLVGLNDVHRQVLDVILVVFGNDVTSNCDFLLVVFVVLAVVVVSRQLKEGIPWVLDLAVNAVNVLL